MSSTTTLNAPVATSRLQELSKYGQSVWLDYIRRTLITSGELKALVDHDGVKGVTSNPAIFEKAITGSTDYSDLIEELQKENLDPMSFYERIAIRDIQDAAGVLRTVYDATNRRDGYVSLEVSPFLANETQATIEEARRLWKAVGRENLMIKVPGTAAGTPAIEQLISEGINVNVTLLFSQHAYESVALAFISGLEKFAAAGGDVSRVHSVASFFVSRIDALVDSMLKPRIKASSDASELADLKSLQSKVAIANAKQAYQLYKNLFGSPRWDVLAAKGAKTQRLLWASTGTKDPNLSDVLYVEELVGRDTVNTIPPATLDAFRDHGNARPSLEEDVAGAAHIMETLAKVGISMDEVTGTLVKQGVKLFADAFDKLLNSVDSKCKVAIGSDVDRQTETLPEAIAKGVDAMLEEWQTGGKVRRLWARDARLWTGTDEGSWLGWLGITEDQIANQAHLKDIAEDVKKAGFEHALLLGMGGSSLCPEVLALSFGKADGFPQMHVLDSTDPAQVKALESKIDIAKTIFIVSSKSGSTLEPNIFKQYFFERTKEVVGADKAGGHFIAVTDPGSKMEQVAKADHFRHIFHGLPSIGGRYSALSDFGMVPAAVMGIDATRFLDQADVMAISCSSCLPASKNPGVKLGAILGVSALHGRDKVTIVASPAIHDLGAWLEQLLAESTGKEGKGLIPVDREELGSPEVYGSDRLFAYLRYEPAADAGQDAAVEAIEKAGHPVVRIAVTNLYNIGQEFFRWEIATAVAGSIIGINAFNQPDVEASKIATRKLTTEYEEEGSLPVETPFFEGEGVKLFSDEKNVAALKSAAGADATLAQYIGAHLNRIGAGDYFALLAYIQMTDEHESALQAIRTSVRDHKKSATCLGFGPRFLHSTGQAYKGGPNSGVFLQITTDDAVDVPVPDQKYTFGTVKAAQARGDFQVLSDRSRRALRVHLSSPEEGLKTLAEAVKQALA
jgi:transaldolase/glucose-6-phosphate isomerase